MRDVGLLFPGAAADAVTDDVAVARALLAVEAAWARAQAGRGVAPGDGADAVERAAAALGADAAALAADLASTVGGANPVIALVARLRAAAPEAAHVVHAGLTSQDVLDTALVLVLRDACRAVAADLGRACASAAALARAHRDAPALGRTLGQAAVPTTLGARFAGWLTGLSAARASLVDVAAALPLAYGGAAGELSGVAALTGDPFALVDAWGEALALPVPAGPWHTSRTPLVRAAAALAEACAALGHVAGDVLQGCRPETGELREPAAPGRGTSSSMAHKRNPVLAVLLRRSAIAAPPLAATVLTAAGLAHDERPDGAWHAEWPALQQLARHAVVGAGLAAELLDGLEVDAAAAEANLRAALPDARGVGAAPAVVDRVLAHLADVNPSEEP
ncbi:lyase family protein [Xylanimonas ulmi]|uniref:3-carboxy-cis,cis-muconate cycloisomerase n=1 Tax=Xylanimonas ulmi TaxID=228973 RepID=A0A4Q7M2T3_9MICO|nr:lyase family protein [Xylanibacterium ulmi]RZS60219.1 3-carboxy-cis,cis-muconate cycloisomerase [Xylanibacterium ulmi]